MLKFWIFQIFISPADKECFNEKGIERHSSLLSIYCWDQSRLREPDVWLVTWWILIRRHQISCFEYFVTCGKNNVNHSMIESFGILLHNWNNEHIPLRCNRYEITDFIAAVRKKTFPTPFEGVIHHDIWQEIWELENDEENDRAMEGNNVKGLSDLLLTCTDVWWLLQCPVNCCGCLIFRLKVLVVSLMVVFLNFF